MNSVLVFSPRQILLAGLIGGPLAAIFAIIKNNFEMKQFVDALNATMGSLLVALAFTLTWALMRSNPGSLTLLVGFVGATYVLGQRNFNPYYIHRFRCKNTRYASISEMLVLAAVSLAFTMMILLLLIG